MKNQEYSERILHSIIQCMKLFDIRNSIECQERWMMSTVTKLSQLIQIFFMESSQLVVVVPWLSPMDLN